MADAASRLFRVGPGVVVGTRADAAVFTVVLRVTVCLSLRLSVRPCLWSCLMSCTCLELTVACTLDLIRVTLVSTLLRASPPTLTTFLRDSGAFQM